MSDEFDVMSFGTDTADSVARTAMAGSLDTVEGQQMALNMVGFGPLVVDGKYGPLSKAAAMRFQASRKLQVDGIIGKATKAALLVAMYGDSGRSDADKIAILQNQTGLSVDVAAQIVRTDAAAPPAPAAPIAPTPAQIQVAVAKAPEVPSLSPPAGYVPVPLSNASYFTGIMQDKKKLMVVGGVAAAVVLVGLLVVKASKKRAA